MDETRTDRNQIESPGNENIDPANIRVLVVDDDPDINLLLRTRLSRRGYQVHSAANGEEALAEIRASPPDVMVLDVSMPGISGLEVLERVRAEGLDLVIVMATAFGTEQVGVEALRRGADDYLRKPFEAAELHAVLERTIRRLILQRQNVELRRRLEENHRRLEAELIRASEIQAHLLPDNPPEIPGFELAGQCLPASQVGGDFYDWQVDPDGRLTFTLGDVMGKGMPAALLMATARAALRAVANRHEPAAAADQVALALEPDLERSGSFVTLFHAAVEPGGRHCRYVDAGHGLAFVLRRDGSTESLRERNLPVGMTFGAPFHSGTLTLKPGEALIVYSDGFIDARPDLDLSPAALATELAAAPTARAMVDRMLDLATSGDGRSMPDDLTLLALRRTSSETGR